MASAYKNLIYSNAEYTRSYQGFSGVEMNASASITDTSRLSCAENMYRDYEADGADVIESIPGFRRLLACNDKIHALYYQRSSSEGDHLIVHTADRLIRYPTDQLLASGTQQGTEISSINNSKSFGFAFGDKFYVMDGTFIRCIDASGRCERIMDAEAAPYIPTTYISGIKHEERNLLTDLFTEEYYVSDPAGFYYSTDGLRYTITDREARYCAVSGADDSVSGDIFIPAYVTISGIEYKVVGISNYAFTGNTSITSVTITNGLSEVGLFAFYKCSGITSVIIPNSVTRLYNGAFVDCVNLNTLYLGDGIKDLGASAFTTCTNLKKVYYSLDETSFNEITNTQSLEGKEIAFETALREVTLFFPIHENTEEVMTVSANGEILSFTKIVRNDTIAGVTITLPSNDSATGLNVKIHAKAKEIQSSFRGDTDEEGGISGFEALSGCTIAEIFDGKIFFSGNPMLPNTVFYTSAASNGTTQGLYVGRYNYFNDGVADYGVKCMLAVRDMLAVFKEGDDGAGSIFYHRKENTDSDALSTIYPVSYVHSGVCAAGAAHSFLDDPVFITDEGLYALENENINYQRNLVCRSHNVNFKLLKEELSDVSLCTWLGYLVVGVNGKIYLADSRSVFRHRTGTYEYDWFFLTGIGTHRNDTGVFCYSYDEIGGRPAHPSKAGEKISADNVYSNILEDGSIAYYTTDGESEYAAIPTEERAGGDFYPATTFISFGKYLFFATDNGDVCVFNNDKRGIPPESLTADAEFNAESYSALMSDKIHPFYYDFATHAPKYVIKTPLDNCGIPHLTKNTVKKSLVIKARSSSAENIKCEVITDSGESRDIGAFPVSDTSFDNFSFTSIPWSVGKYTSSALPEKEKKWIEKQIVLASDRYRCPISVYSITYRYCIKGKIKNNS